MQIQWEQQEKMLRKIMSTRGEINLWRPHPAFCILTIWASENSPRTWSRWLNRLLHWQNHHIFLPFYSSAQKFFIKIKPTVHLKKSKTKQENNKTICCCNFLFLVKMTSQHFQPFFLISFVPCILCILREAVLRKLMNLTERIRGM